jgi:hypothetical protein
VEPQCAAFFRFSTLFGRLRNVKPKAPRIEVATPIAIGGLLGLSAGLVLGVVAGAAGLIVGLVGGTAAGIAAGLAIRLNEWRREARSSELDRIISMDGLGAAPVSMPPPETPDAQESQYWLAEWLTPPPPPAAT